MALDRDDTLKKAEKLLRQGRLDAAIAEYVRVVEDQPRDWTTANTLGDLYARAGQSARAVAQYARMADHFADEGFYPKAAALYKKILKLTPDDETTQVKLAELSSRQGLLADARSFFNAVLAKRRARGDARGADEIVIRLGEIDPADVEPDDARSRISLARAALASGDLDEARRCLDRDTAGSDPDLLFALAGLELRSGRPDAARDILPQLLAADPGFRQPVLDLAWTLTASDPDAAFVCIDAAVDGLVGAGDFEAAAAILQECSARAPGQVPALLKLVEVCVDGGLEARMYETQAQLADAYLAAGQAAEARVIAEDLVAREPWQHAHVDRFRRALVMLRVPEPDSVIAERLSGQSPFTANDLFSNSSVGGPVAAAEASEADPIGPIDPTDPTEHAEASPDDRPLPADEQTAPPSPPAPSPAPQEKGAGVVEIDLTSALSDLEAAAPPPAPVSSPPPTLEEVFQSLRRGEADKPEADEASQYLDLARTYLEMGHLDEGISSLQTAARAPSHRFVASAMLGQVYRDQGDLPHAVEWFERAAEAPAPGVDESRALLYELACLLELIDESARALAVFLELQSEAGEYRDVATRVEHLARVQTGG